jgi:Fe-S-cluster containining protein
MSGAVLKRTEDDVCIFLGAEGCSVHPDRPLVCRLYPLGRRVAPDGTEVWLRSKPHPDSEGEYTIGGTIGDFIEAQGALPFMQAADNYAQWVREAGALIDASGDAANGVSIPNDLLDMDSVIAAYCAETDVAEPSDIEDRRKLHMIVLYRQLDRIEGGSDD